MVNRGGVTIRIFSLFRGDLLSVTGGLGDSHAQSGVRPVGNFFQGNAHVIEECVDGRLFPKTGSEFHGERQAVST